jgi:hypothetical protein
MNQETLILATPEHCLELMSNICKDLKNIQDPTAIHVRLGANSNGQDLEEHRDLLIRNLVNDFELVFSRFKQLKGIR